MKWLLLSILVLAGVIRGWGIDKVPPELFGDELDVGYQTYSLLKTGQDLYGQTLPTYIHSLAEWRAPLLMYATVPSVAVLGLNEWGVRVPEVVFGVLAIPLMFLLVYETTRSKTAAILSCLLLALTPWHIYYSRAAFEVVLLVDLIMAGTLLFLKQRWLSAALFFALAMYCYSTAVVFVPLWLVCLGLTTRRAPKLRAVGLWVVLLLPLAYHIVAGPARERFGTLSIFRDEQVIKEVLIKRQQYPSAVSKLFNNRYERIANIFAKNYAESFSTEFLLIRGDPVYRHSIQTTGQLLLPMGLLLAVGLYSLAKRKHWVWLVWLMLAPLPASLTQGGGHHATRLMLMLPPLVAACGMGLAQIWEWRRWAGGVTLLVILSFFVQNAYIYTVEYPVESWRWWEVGYKDAITSLNQVADNYQQVFIINTYEPALIRYLFWTHYDPAKFHQEFTIDQPQPGIAPNYDGFALGSKVIFGQFSEESGHVDMASRLLPGAIYLISQREDVAGDWDWRTSPPAGVKVIHTSTNLTNQPVFYLITKE